MNVTKERIESTMTNRVTFEFDDIEFAKLKLDWMDRALLDDGEDQPADVLLKAELIARRIWEQRNPVSA